MAENGLAARAVTASAEWDETLEVDLGEVFQPSAEAAEGRPCEPEPGGVKPEPASLVEMLEAIFAGQAEGGDDTSDSGVRYALGLAYREEGLVDEAIAEFQQAARDQDRAADCTGMVAVCCLEKGATEEAVTWFDRVLQASGWREE